MVDITIPRSLPSFRRMMIFVDGENLVFRYKSMLKQGWKASPDVTHILDEMVWHPDFSLCFADSLNEILKVTYYTYVTGDDVKITTTQERIKSLEFKRHSKSGLPNNITPRIFKKTNASIKGKGIDIQMTVDILNHVCRDNVDAVALFSGDGDYFPVIDEVQRCGKQCYISAFSSGLNDNLRYVSDQFLCLDDIAFCKH